MRRTGLQFQGLQSTQACVRSLHGGHIHVHRRRLWQAQLDLRQAVCATQSATGAPCHLPSAFFQAGFTLRCHVDLHFHAQCLLYHFQSVNLLGVIDQSFGQGKAQRKVFQVHGRGHHDSMADAIEHQRYWHFICQFCAVPQMHLHLPTTSKLSDWALANKSNWVLLKRW